MFLARRTILTSLQKIKTNQNLFRVLPKCNKSSQVKALDDVDEEKPVPYSKSAASSWKASYSRSGTSAQRLWYEPYVIIASISIFMVYFFILREESDWDRDLEKNLYERVEGLEQKQLEIALAYNKSHGLETEALVARLKELKEEQEQKHRVVE